MAASRAQTDQWFNQAVRNGATHMLVVVDGFDYEDYPVPVLYGEDVQEKIDKYDGKEMQRVMEVYDLSISKEVQLEMTRAWNTGPAPVRDDA
jgi:hypothetical protein